MNSPQRLLHISALGGARLWRLGVQALLADRPGIQAVDHAASIADIAGKPDVILINGPAAENLLPKVRAAQPETPTLIITPTADLARLSRWIKQGALGMVDDNATLPDLLAAIRQAATGELSLPPALAVRMVQTMTARATPDDALVEPLSAREKEVLVFLARGLSNKAIAQQLYVSVRTVEGHLANIYGKLGVHSRTEAALIAVKNGWVASPPNT